MTPHDPFLAFSLFLAYVDYLKVPVSVFMRRADLNYSFRLNNSFDVKNGFIFVSKESSTLDW